MADEVLRRNLELALDPGPDFPDRSLLPRTMAVIAAGSPSRPARPRRAWTGLEWTPSRRINRVIAIAVAVVIVVGAMGAFVAVYRYAGHLIPAHLHPRASSCSGNGFPRMVSGTGGWNGPSVTEDAGATWRDVSPPGLPGNSGAGGFDLCALDGEHAWMTWPEGASQQGPDHLVLFATSDGGQTWQQQATFPDTDQNGSAKVEFIDPRNGWLLVNQSTARAVYASHDGGATWTRVSGLQSLTSPLENAALDCAPTGVTFINLERGWITWDCSSLGSGSAGRAPGAQSGAGPTDTSVVVVTNDGGRTWSDVRLPGLAEGIAQACSVDPPLFTNDSGVMVVNCAGGPTGLAIYDTSDGGTTWTHLEGPADFLNLGQIGFGDAFNGYALLPERPSYALYRTVDGGRHWSVKAHGLFAYQDIASVQFVDASTGFVFTNNSAFEALGQTPWTTQDGGLVWRHAGSQRTLASQIACANPDASQGGPPVPVAMFGDVVWAQGALRSTDGGAHWSNVAPPSIPNRSPGTVEYYLDATHAWVAETAGSDSACADHVAVFGTADGGKTWQMSNSVTVPTNTPNDQIWTLYGAAGSRLNPIGPVWLDFVDPSHGWMQPFTYQLGSGGAGPQYGPLYRTTDGGMHWAEVSDPRLLQICVDNADIRFSSPTTGWLSAGSCTTDSFYDVTHDGGATWTPVDLPCCRPAAPVFFDALHGMALGSDGSTGAFVEIVTSDGGQTWTRREMKGFNGYAAIAFADPAHGWAVVTPTTAYDQVTLLRTTDGGATWTTINANMPASGPIGSYSLVFGTARLGLLKTDSALFRTSDGGRTWAAV